MNKQNDTIVFDFQSSRHKDENGFLHVSTSHISKETVNPYYGLEIPNYNQLGLDPEHIYYGYRKGEELEKGAKTFNGLPLLLGHYAESAEDPQTEHRVGSLGTDSVFTTPYLNNSLIITDVKAIESVEKGISKQISCAYRYDPVFTRGTFEGQEYDFIMTNIRGNHVALVEEGRAGADVAVADSALQKKSPSSQEHGTTKEASCDEKDKGKTSPDTAMDDRKSNFKPQRKGSTTMGKIRTLARLVLKKSGLANDEAPSEEVLQATEQLIEAVGEEVAEQILTDPQQVMAESIKKVVEDDSLDDEAKTQAIIDLTVSTPATTGEVQPETTETQVKVSAIDEETALSDETVDTLMRNAGLDPTDKVIRSGFLAGLLANKTASDEEPKSADKEDDKKVSVTAQDAALIRNQAVLETTNHLKSLEQAGRDVVGLCGAINIFSFDSASDIYTHALKSCGRNVSTKDVSALRDMVAMAKDAKNQVIQRKPKEAIPQNGAFSHLTNITVSR